MNWAGLFVLIGLVSLAYQIGGWGLLLLLLVIPLVLELNRSRSRKPAPRISQSRDDERVAPSTALELEAAPPHTKFRFEPPGLVTPPPEVALIRRSRDLHFQRHALTPGWLYVARNGFHAPDLFKVGYTTVSPMARMRTLNALTRGVTSAIGRFQLVHSRSVPKSYTAEQQVFARLAKYRVSGGREFFRASQALIVDAVDSVADAAVAACTESVTSKRIGVATCPDCGRTQRYEAAPFAIEIDLCCPPCGNVWNHDTTI